MDYQQLKQQQVAHMNKAFRQQTVATSTTIMAHNIATYLAERPMQTALDLLGEDITGKAILSICAGTGEEAIFLHQRGAKVTATDISEEACRLIQQRDPGFEVHVADAEQLPYPDQAFDYVIVKHGLHHLPRPILGVYEMLRVAKRGILVLEAQDTWLMSLLIKIGLVQAIEESGNFVYRFTRREMKKIFNTMFIPDVKIHTAWYQYVPWCNQHIYPWLNNPLGFKLFKALLTVGNALLGYWGNNFIMVVKKPQS